MPERMPTMSRFCLMLTIAGLSLIGCQAPAPPQPSTSSPIPLASASAGPQVSGKESGLLYEIPPGWEGKHNSRGLLFYTPADDHSAIIQFWDTAEGKGLERFADAVGAMSKMCGSGPGKAERVKLGQLDAISSTCHGTSEGRSFEMSVYLVPDKTTDLSPIDMTLKSAFYPRVSLVMLTGGSDTGRHKSEVATFLSSFHPPH